MAISNGVFVDTIVKALNNDIALDLGGTIKMALFTNSLVPDFSQVSPAYGSSPFNANEISGTGYTAGGEELDTPVFEESGTAGTTRWTWTGPTEWEDSTITNARGALFYVPSLSSVAVVLRTFGQDYSTQSGVLSVSPGTGGIWGANLLP